MFDPIRRFSHHLLIRFRGYFRKLFPVLNGNLSLSDHGQHFRSELVSVDPQRLVSVFLLAAKLELVERLIVVVPEVEKLAFIAFGPDALVHSESVEHLQRIRGEHDGATNVQRRISCLVHGTGNGLLMQGQGESEA